MRRGVHQSAGRDVHRCVSLSGTLSPERGRWKLGGFSGSFKKKDRNTQKQDSKKKTSSTKSLSGEILKSDLLNFLLEIDGKRGDGNPG